MTEVCLPKNNNVMLADKQIDGHYSILLHSSQSKQKKLVCQTMLLMSPFENWYGLANIAEHINKVWCMTEDGSSTCSFISANLLSANTISSSVLVRISNHVGWHAGLYCYNVSALFHYSMLSLASTMMLLFHWNDSDAKWQECYTQPTVWTWTFLFCTMGLWMSC